jgi:hypothetical protein
MPRGTRYLDSLFSLKTGNFGAYVYSAIATPHIGNQRVAFVWRLSPDIVYSPIVDSEGLHIVPRPTQAGWFHRSFGPVAYGQPQVFDKSVHQRPRHHLVQRSTPGGPPTEIWTARLQAAPSIPHCVANSTD